MAFKKILLGTAMMSSVRVLRLLAQFVAIPILSRLLTPADYGLVALAMPFALFAMMLADAGIGMSLVRTPPSERVVWSSCFWLTVLLGLAVAGAMAALGPLAAYLFHEPVLAPMVMTLAFVVFAQSVHLVPIAALQQAHRFRTIAGVEILCISAGIGTAVTMALAGYGAWALIGQQVAFFAARMVLVVLASPFRPQAVLDRSVLGAHLTFGRDVLGNSLVNFCGRTLDNWVVGEALGAALLGVYSMAFQFARLPAMLVTGPLQYVLYAQLAPMKGSPAAMAPMLLLLTRLLALVIFPVMTVVAVAHAPLFTLLLSAKWAQAGQFFMLLAPATALQAVLAIGETLCFALGRTALQLRASAEFALLWIGALLVAVMFGLKAAALAYTLAVLIYAWRYMGRLLPLLQCRFRDYGRAYLPALCSSAAAASAYLLLDGVWELALVEHMAASALLAITAVGCGLWTQKAALMQEVALLRLARGADTAH